MLILLFDHVGFIGDFIERIASIEDGRILLVIDDLANATLVEITCLLQKCAVVCIEALLFLIDLNPRNFNEAILSRERGKGSLYTSMAWLYELWLIDALRALLAVIDFHRLDADLTLGV